MNSHWLLGDWCETPANSTAGAKHPRSAKQGALKTDANLFGTSFLKCETPANSTAGAKHPRSAKQGALKTDANLFGTSFLAAVSLILGCDANYFVEIEGHLTTSGRPAEGARILLLGGAHFAEVNESGGAPMAVADANGAFKVKYGGLNQTPRPNKLLIDFDSQIPTVLSPGEDFSFSQPTRRLWHANLKVDLASKHDVPLQVSCKPGRCTTLVSRASNPDFCYPSLYIRNRKVPSFANISRVGRDLLGEQVKFDFEVPDDVRAETLILIVDCHDDEVFVSEPFDID